MAVSQLPQAPYRQDRRIYPTPIIGDVLFSEVRDCTRIEIPEYGTPHPNTNKWPDHKLVFVKTVDIERDGIYEFFYAAERENQDLYNFSSGYRNVVGNAGGREFRVVQRSYVTLRDKFQPMDIEFATPMMDVPEGKFDDIEYVFFDRQQQPIQDQELNALFVAEVHTYIEKAFLDYKISYSTQKGDVVPEKFRVAIPQKSTEQIVEGLAAQPVLTGSQLSVSEDQINPDIKVVKIISREEPEDDISLVGRRAYVEGGPPANIIETYSKDEIEVDTGVNVVQSTTTPLGDGSFVRETIEVDSWPELKSSEWDPLINAQVVSKRQFVPPPTSFNEENVSFQAVNEDRSLKITEVVPEDALEKYHVAMPTRTDIQMPTVLKSISVIWADDDSISDGDSEGSAISANGGTGFSLQASASSNGSAAKSANPYLNIEYQNVFGSDIRATAHFFYTKTVNNSLSENELVSRLNALTGFSSQPWPIFKPTAHTIITRGARVTAVASASATEQKLVTIDGVEGSSRTKTEDGSFSIDRSVDVVTINPTLHGPITILNASAYSSILATASAKARLTGDFNTAATKINAATAPVGVSPISLPATSPTDIPRTGNYIISSKAEPFKWGWVKCFALVVDASQFA
jgi:hypothetical protein